MLRKRATSGTTDGALVVVFGMLLGALLLLVVQRYGETVEERTSLYWMRLRSQMGAADIILDNGK